MIKCSLCGGKTKVTNTINQEDGVIKRKRQCLVCKRHFYTKETFDDWTEEVVREKVEAGEWMMPKKQKTQLTGIRSNDKPIPKPIDWDKIQKQLESFDDSNVIYNEKGDN